MFSLGTSLPATAAMNHHTAAALAVAAALAAQGAAFAPAAIPMLQHHRCALRQTAAAPRMGLFDGLLGDKKSENAVTFKEWTFSGTVDGPKGAGLVGNVDVVFKIGEEVKSTRAFAGAPLSEVAAQVRMCGTFVTSHLAGASASGRQEFVT